MEAIPWYRSPVYVAAVTSIVSQIVALAGWTDQFPTEQISGAVAIVFQIIALASTWVVERQRRKSQIQPLTLTKGAAEAKNQSGHTTGGHLLAVVAVTLTAWIAVGCMAALERAKPPVPTTPDETFAVLFAQIDTAHEFNRMLSTPAAEGAEPLQSMADGEKRFEELEQIHAQIHRAWFVWRERGEFDYRTIEGQRALLQALRAELVKLEAKQ